MHWGGVSFITNPEIAYADTKLDNGYYLGISKADDSRTKDDNANGKGAGGTNSITIGHNSTAGTGTITIGDRRADDSKYSVYLGEHYTAANQAHPDPGSHVTSIGYDSDARGTGSIALGSGAEADVNRASEGGEKNPDADSTSVAIGYQAKANKNNIAIGAKSVASDKASTTAAAFTNQAAPKSYVSVGDGIKDSDTQYRRISNVADGAADSDAATISQLRKAVEATDASKKANIDATNIGKNLKYKADGKTAADSSDITTNEDAWGTAIGTGSIANSNTNGSGQLVTGTTVYNYVSPKAVDGKELKYISEDESTGTNLGILDDKVSTNATDITGLKSLSNITDNGKTVIKKAAVGAVKVTAGDRITVTPDSKNLTDADTVTYTISAKNDGKVASGNSGLVSGDTVYQALQNQTKSLTYNNGWGIIVDNSTKKISLNKNLTTKIIEGWRNDPSRLVEFKLDKTAMAIGGAIFNNSGSGNSYVDGLTMTINSDGPYSVSLGGINNSTKGRYSTVTGGAANVASGYASSVNGGKNNTASGKYATVIGGGYLWTEVYDNGDFPDVDNSIFGSYAYARNDASGDLSTVVGGHANKASGKQSLVAGGSNNSSNEESASVFGGADNIAAKWLTTVSGGLGNIAENNYSSIYGGIMNRAEGIASTASGGYYNIIASNGPIQPNEIWYGSQSSGRYGSAFGGAYNLVGGESGAAIGGGHSVVYGERSVGLAGGSTGLGAHYALAAGYQSVVTSKGSKLLTSDKHDEFTDDYHYDRYGYAHKITIKDANETAVDLMPEYVDVATAVGYQATANETNTVSFGHDVGDVSGYAVKWKERTDKDERGNINRNLDGSINDYTKVPDVIANHYDTAKYNRLVKVADGINNHDAVVMEQLRNADNVGKNAKNNVVVYKKNADGSLQVDEYGEAIVDDDASKAETEKATEQAIKDSGDAWGRALGTGKVEANNSQLVTGDTVYNAIQNQAEWKLTTNGESADKAAAIKPGTTVDFSAEKKGKDHSNVTISHEGSNVTIGLDKEIVLGDTTHGNGGSLNVYSDSSDGNNQSNHVSINGSTINVNYKNKAGNDTRGVILGVGKEDGKPDGYIAFNNVEGGYTYLHASTDASDDKKGRLEYVGNDGNKKYIANLDDVSTAVNNAKTKYYAVNGDAPIMSLADYSNAGNDGAKGEGSLAAGFVTHADGIASTVAGSYSGVINSGKAQGLDLRGAAALSYGTFNVNQNTEAKKEHSGVANSIVGQVNVTKDSNAAIIYGAGNIVTDSYRPIDEKKAADILGSTSDPKALSKAMQDAVKDSGGQVMVMGGGNSVDKAYMTQVVGVGNKVTGQDSTYAEKTSTQYNFVDGFQNELKNGKNDYIIGTKNKVSGDSVDKNQSNIIFGDNHTLTNTKNAVIIGSSDKVTEIAGSDAVSIGYNANAGGESVALGSNAVAGGNALAVGPYANAKNNSIALGIHASATSSQNLAIGYYANVTGRPDTIKNSVALGASSTVGEKDILSTDNGFGVLSIGAKDKERRIIHVRAGVNDTDAVNVSQLKSVQSGLTDKGLTFVTNDGEHIAKLGSKVTIQGTAKKADHEYTADNLTTEIDKDGNITILMDKDMSVEKLAVNGKPGTPGSIGVKGQDGQSGVGIDGKDGISIKGQNGKDGVTIKGIDGVDGVDGAEGHIGLNGKDGMTDIFTTAGTPGLNGKDGETMTRIVYKDPKGTEHEAATLDDGLKFKGDDGKEIAKKLNNTLDIIGGAKGDLTEGNIGVNSTDKGQLKVQLAKDLKGITSISNQKTEGGKTTGAKITLGDDGSVNVNGGKITNVGSGADASGKYTETTNAANIGDVQKIAENTATGLTGKGLKFAANSGDEYTAKLGSTVKIQGTAKKAGHEYTADNLTTEIDKDGNITILMDKNVSAEKIAVNGKDGENGKPGTAGSIGISGQDGKAGVGIDGKDGISIKGQNGKDGVTIKGIDGVDGVDGAEGHIGLNGKDGMTDIFTTAGTPGLNGKDGETMTRIVYKDPKGTEHEAATLDDGLKFKGDDGKEIAKKLNNTLDIIGGAKGDLTEGNIGVNSTDKGQLKVQLAKDLKGITSISNQKTEGGKTTGAKITLGDDGSVNVNGGKITNVGSGADASGKYTTTTNAANIGDVQKIVKDAVDSAADTTNKALAGKANVDASNIGANLKGEDGKAASAEAQKANAEKWGSAIGTGKIEKDNGQLVTGKTVYEYNKPVAEDGKTLNYVSEGKTTGQNLGALDAQVKNNADAIKKNSESIQNITNNVKNLSDNAVQYDKDSNKTKVTLGGDGGTTITNVMDGALSDNSTDAVNGKQLYNEQEARKAADNAITEKVTNNTNEITKIENGEGFTDAGTTVIKNLAKDAVQVKAGTAITVADNVDDKGNKTYTISANNNGTVTKDDGNLISGGTLYNEVHVTTDGSYIKGSQTVGQNLSSLDSGLKTTSDLIHTNTAGDTIQIGGNSTATKIDVNGKDGKGRVITGVVSDANDPTSAANVGYVNGAYGRLNNNINKAAAGSNALAALHPLDYDPDDKADFAVGYGHYRNANAAAVGAFYHPNENTMVNVGVSLGNGDPGFNAGVSFKVGRGGAGREAMSKTEMAKVINSQSKEIDALKKDNADKDKRIDALEQKMAEILAKLDKNGK